MEFEYLRDLLLEAGALLRDRYEHRASLPITAKRDVNDLVTEADLAVQHALVERIRQRFPHDVIVAEEEGLTEIPADQDVRAWVIDPIDGTMNFVRGLFPAFGISVAFAQGGVPVAGGVAFPLNADVFLAERGGGAYRNGRRMHVSDVASVDASRGEVDFGIRSERERTLVEFGRVVCQLGQLRCHGAAVAGLCAVAAGDADLYFHVGLAPWDYAAGQVLIEEAGGKVTRLNGAAVRLFDRGRGMVASNGHVHAEALSLIDRQPE